MTETSAVRKAISFHFHPYQFENQKHFVEKSDAGGKKRRYLCGITSGPRLDGHEERMTEKCIKSFMDQANAGDVLLYPDIHGIKASEDIGTLAKAEIQPNGDWYTEYRLYDEDDGIGPVKKEKIEDLWKQSTGQAPYKAPKQKGFSIEGYIPPDGLISFDKDDHGNVSKRIIDQVELDGVILVPRPAYRDSVANAIYKALGEVPAGREIAIKKSLEEELGSLESEKEIREKANQYFKGRWDIQDAFDRVIEKIMKRKTPSEDKQKELEVVFEEYKSMMIDLILRSERMFQENNDAGLDVGPYTASSSNVSKASRADLFKGLRKQLVNLKKILMEEVS